MDYYSSYDYDASYRDEIRKNEMYEDYDELPLNMNMNSFYDTWINCIIPSAIQIFEYIGKLLIWNIICRIGWILVLGNRRIPYVEHIISAFCGLMLLYSIIGSSFIHIILFNCISYFILFLLIKKYRSCGNSTQRNEKFQVESKSNNVGLILGAICLCVLPICEIIQNTPKIWHQIRGIHMILVMKSVSLAFDLNLKKNVNMPNFFQYSGYMLCPGNCLLGPWIPYDEYIEVFNRQKYNIKWLFWVVTNSLAATFFILISNCFTSMLIFNSKWFNAYKDALSFRSSHYFVSFLSQATMSAIGIVNIKDISYSPIFGSLITRPWKIELPISLVQVVINWNIPMHRWLKTYVFQVMKPHGKALAIFVTYLVSSMLHGLNFQLYAVLLSLGFYTFVEYNLRYKLGQIFNACILAIPCVKPKSTQHSHHQNIRTIGDQRNCKHLHKSSNSVVLLSNLIFSLLTMFHLCYLGVMFEASTIQEEGYSMEHTFIKWRTLDFLSHWVMLILYLFYFVI